MAAAAQVVEVKSARVEMGNIQIGLRRNKIRSYGGKRKRRRKIVIRSLTFRIKIGFEPSCRKEIGSS